MSYTGTDHAAQARSYQSTAAAATRRAEREARQAADFYRQARLVREQVAWLTARPDLWDADYNPAELESRVAAWVRLAGVYLRASFGADASAVFYRGLAATYRDMAARQAARLAEL